MVDDDISSNPSAERPICEVIAARIGRRQAIAGMASLAGLGLAGGILTGRCALANDLSTLAFAEVEHGYDETHHVAEGYEAEILIRWGDPVLPDAPAFDVANQTAAAQLGQFGYNNDFIAFMPLPRGSSAAERGLLCVNHEYTNANLMFPGHPSPYQLSREQVDVEMAAHGHSVVEVRKRDGRWSVVRESRYNRRLSAMDTRMRLSGPAAGNRRLRTKVDPSGSEVIGTLNNCAGGKTPWGTVLIAEENFHKYFGGDPAGTAEARNYKRYGFKALPMEWISDGEQPEVHAWWRFHERFNVDVEPNEPNRFGWIVEYDPYDPESVPVKRTALGRFKHEGAATVVNRDGRVVVYSGDDQRFDYVYRFVSDGRFDPNDRDANRDLLDHGVLFVARFDEDGTVTWRPLVWGTGPLVPANGFESQADVLIETRRAADLLGATPMDRPEDVEANPVTGAVYVMLTNNTRRTDEDTNPVNPRPGNKHGHILELVPPGGRGADADHAAPTYRWEVPVLCGNPADPDDRAKYHPRVSASGWLSTPDNCAFDSRGRLWIATDGAPKSGFADGIWAMDVEGPGRSLTRHFMRTPRGAELSGPEFTPDGRTLFCAVQHPADEKGSTFESPTTRWPDFDTAMPPRPSVLAVTKKDGGPIGA